MNRSPQIDVAQLAVEHQAAVYRAAYRLCGSVVDAEDLTQQTFLTAFRVRDQLREPAAARGWLMTILRSCFLKSVRRRRPVAAVDRELELDGLPGPVPEASIVDPESLQRALNELTPESRLILMMFYFENQSYREIAATLEVPLGTVMSRLSRSKEQLRRRLEGVDKQKNTDTAKNEMKPKEVNPRLAVAASPSDNQPLGSA